MIRQIGQHKYRLYSRKKDKHGKRRNLGTFTTRQGAETRERQVQFFKHGESVDYFGIPQLEWEGDDDRYVDPSVWKNFLPAAEKLGLSSAAARTLVNYNSGGYGIPWEKVKFVADELKRFAKFSGKVYRIHHYLDPKNIITGIGDVSVGDVTYIESPGHLLSTSKDKDYVYNYIEHDEYHVVFEIMVKPSDIFIDFTEIPKSLASLLHYPEDASHEVVLRPGSYKAKVIELFHEKGFGEFRKRASVQKVSDWSVK